MRIEKEQTVAIGIDYQEKLVPVMHKKEKLIENSRILLSGLSTLEVPICLTQQYTKGLGDSTRDHSGSGDQGTCGENQLQRL